MCSFITDLGKCYTLGGELVLDTVSFSSIPHTILHRHLFSLCTPTKSIQAVFERDDECARV